MNYLLVLMFGALVLGLLPRLDQRRLAPLALGLAVLVTVLYFLSSRGR